MVEDPKIKRLIKGCKKGKENSQLALYKHYYSYGLSICLRYSDNRETAMEIMNDGFLKVFQKIDQFDKTQAFKPWLRRILINAAIDYHRKYKVVFLKAEVPVRKNYTYNEALDHLEYKDLLHFVQKLPKAYRIVFNLYVIEGMSHAEVAQKLSISIGTSKSNLAKARKKLKAMVNRTWKIQVENKY